MYKKASNSINHVGNTQGIIDILQATTLGERVFEKHSARIKQALATRKATKTQALSLRHFSWEA